MCGRDLSEGDRQRDQSHGVGERKTCGIGMEGGEGERGGGGGGGGAVETTRHSIIEVLLPILAWIISKETALSGTERPADTDAPPRPRGDERKDSQSSPETF
ncbi:hypothetical protein EYF80_027647 [Liparis tanakae]|uniref:Uncharacterized protein n=1 Tax=Liparis tanakae TaxID=230148 RepID=A0A4Z2H8C0_9TELE|nr:hypothetical protein EYF80_027647 [Liparis tanakae]